MPYKNIEDERNRCKRHYEKHKEQILQRIKIYRKENPEKIKEQSKRCYEKNKGKNREKHLECCKQWYIDNREKHLQRSKQYNKENSQHYHEISKKYYKEHSKKLIEKRKIWVKNNPIKAKEAYIRHSNKRKGLLGFNPLNKYFDGSEAHHINKNDVIYIPKEIHRSIWHCLKTGLNMKEINKLAINYLNKGGISCVYNGLTKS